MENLQRVEVLQDSEQPESVLEARRLVAELEHDIELVRQRMEPPLEVRALWDRGTQSPTYILRRGEYDKPGHLVGPGVPSVLTDGKTPFVPEPPFPDGTPKTGRRLAFAHWLIQPTHPLTSRVMVNRIWYHHFGTGLVKSLENFGVKGEPPSHPELLDWLAMEFVERGWSVKQMHRLIMNSRTYRQSSRITDEHQRLDPQNQLLSRMPLRRMDAESLRDSMLFVSGRLDDRHGGRPDSVSVNRDGLVSINPTPDNLWRRSVYAQYRRTEIPSMLETFDYPEMGPNCMARNVSVISPQSLMMINNDHVRELAESLASRVDAMLTEYNSDGSDTSKPESERLIETVYSLALSRSPNDVERHIGVKALNTLQSEWHGDRHAALATYCHTILNSAAFLYID